MSVPKSLDTLKHAFDLATLSEIETNNMRIKVPVWSEKEEGKAPMVLISNLMDLDDGPSMDP